MRGAVALLVFFVLLVALVGHAPAVSARTHAPHSDAALDSIAAFLRSSSPVLAESLATQWLQRAESAQPPDSLLMARALQLTGWARWTRRALRDTLALGALGRSVAIESALAAPDARSLSVSEQIRGRLFVDLGRSAEAIAPLQRAIALRVPLTGDSDSLVADTWYWLGQANRRLRRQADALAALERSRSLWAGMAGAGSPKVAFVLAEVGGTLLDLGNYAAARDTLELAQAINDRTLAPNDDARIYPLNLLSMLHFHTGDIAGSIEDLQQGLDVLIRAHGPQEIHTQPFRYNLALRYLELGEFEQARLLLTDALASFESVYGPTHFRSANTRLILGVTEALMADTARARADLEFARGAIERGGQDPNGARAHADRWLAFLASARGDHAAAGRLLAAAFALEQASPTPSFETLAALYELQQQVQRRAGDLPGLARTVAGIDTLAADTSHISSVGFATLLRSRALAHEALGHSAAAWNDALRAEAIDRERQRLNTLALPDRQALALAGNASQSLDVLLRLALHGGEAEQRAAWDRLVRWRGLVAAEVEARRAPPLASRDTSLAGGHGRWIAAQQRYAQAMVADAGDADSTTLARLDALRDAAESAEREYGRRAPRAAGATPALDLGLDQVLAHLGRDEALVGTCELESSTDSARTIAFVARGADRSVRLVDLGPSAAMRGTIERWTAALSTPPSAAGAAPAEAAARRLGARVLAVAWEPLARAAGTCRAWHLVGDGPLQDLPWQALPEGTGRYLVESGPLVHVLDAERVLAAAPEPEAAGGLLALGGPRFDASVFVGEPIAATVRGPLGRCDAAGPLALPELPAAREEVEDAGRTWSAAHPDAPAEVLVGDAATEAAFKRDAPGRRVLHLATHGIVWSDSCQPMVRDLRGVGGVTPLASAATAARPGRVAARKPPVAPGFAPKVSPWAGRQTWLALAGADHARSGAPDGNDGLLTAEEVMTLDLRGVDWVLLSACQSGVGATWPHEGAEGMRRAFRLAGAGTVIASQWSVADESARDWMRDLYAARNAGTRDADAAMSEASRAFLADRRARGRTTHPFYWAGFVASGR